MKNEESLSSVLMRSNSSFFILNSSLIKNYGKENPSIHRHAGAYSLPRRSYHRINRKPADQTCRDMELVIKIPHTPASSPKKS